MTSSTDTRPVIVLGDMDTGTRLEMLETRATECGGIAETHTFEEARPPNRTTSPTSAPRSRRCARPYVHGLISGCRFRWT